jgi:chemotaxis-related protein WspD
VRNDLLLPPWELAMNNIVNDFEFDDCWNQIGVWSRAQNRCGKLEQYIHCQNCPVYAVTGKHLLEREMPENYLAECTDNFSTSKEELDHNLVSAIIFRIGDEYYALPTLILSEITAMSPIHSIPHRKNRVFRGIINIRGELLFCFSLGSLFELTRGKFVAQHELQACERLIILKHNDDRYSFPVSEIVGIHKYNPENMGTAPSTLSDGDSCYINGVIDIEGKHVGCLDSDLLIRALDRMTT